MNRRGAIAAMILIAVQVLGVGAARCDTPQQQWKSQSVRSKDGTRIVFHREGHGTPLVIVHGGWSTSQAYKPLGELLSGNYEVILVERRNYGVSDTGPTPHSFARDGEDVQAVIHAVGRPCYLFGHSGGALAALYAVLESSKDVRALALYEPPLTAGGPPAASVLKKYEGFLAAKDYQDAVLIGLTGIIGYPVDDANRRAPIYVQHLSGALWTGAAHDVEALSSMNTDPSQWSGLKLPVLLMRGEKSNEHPLLDSTRALAAAIPGAQVTVLSGQEHTAAAVVPGMVANTLRGFFKP